jgi:GNAT superfamily N-acetyltransferase
MDRREWHERVRESMVGFWRLLAESTGGQAWERDGVVAAVVPAVPERSVFNSVVYSDAGALVDSIEELAALYDEAGVLAWTVWVPEDDGDAAAALERAGHDLDAAPRAMGMDLAAAEEPEMGELDWFRDCDLATLGRVNDLAYGYRDGPFERTLGTLPAERVHAYGVRVDGEPAAVLATSDWGEDTEISFVATAEAARGRGLATALMRQSLWDARERGCQTATLQATKPGAPVYERVGFEDFGALQMWERRRQA